jgi:glycosyltransferase involved in cell wall biosynthesis
MILVFETNWTGTTHAPGNSATVQILARAFPGQEVRVHADATHLAELRRDAALMALPNIGLVPIAVPAVWQGRPHIVSARRMLAEFRTIRAALGAVPAEEPCLVFLISTSCTGSFAAAWAARLSGRRRIGVQVGLHGNLNDATSGWRPRNPLRRGFDTRSALEARYPVPLRFLVLEDAIRTALQSLLPAAAARTDVVPLPVNTAEVPAAAESAPGLAPPIRIGFVGLGTPAKGMDSFLEVARRVRARHGADRVQFVHVGRMPAESAAAGAEVLADPPATEHLARAEFVRRLASLHYVFLPYRRGYYDLSASGALIDALTWLKPVIATRVPLTEQFFAEYGDIGLLGDDDAALEAAVEQVVAHPDPARHAHQVEALRAARETRRVDALAARYRALVEAGFPLLLERAGDGR